MNESPDCIWLHAGSFVQTTGKLRPIANLWEGGVNSNINDRKPAQQPQFQSFKNLSQPRNESPVASPTLYIFTR